MKLSKSNFNSIFSKERKITLFGSSEIARKTFRKISKERIACVVDNSKNLQGSNFEDIIIQNPNDIPNHSYILICSTAITPISEQLIKMGFTPEKDFTISPILNDLLIIEELENLKSDFYFTSGNAPLENEPYGGGLYHISFDKEYQEVRKVYSGSCYGTIKYGKKIIFIDTDNGIMSYDPHLNEVKNIAKTPANSRAHGISYNDANKCFYISCSNLDGVIEYNSEFQETKRFLLSDKLEYHGNSMHHCNDNFSTGNSLFVSMFSSTGNWKKGVFDGCIAEFDIRTGKRLNDIKQGLYMPHNVCEINGMLQVLDSLPGHLRTENFEILGTFPAFTRGLAYKNGYYYVGQSKNRNFSKVIGVSNNISVDCGIIIFDPNTKVSRTLKLSNRIGEIHSIQFL